MLNIKQLDYVIRSQKSASKELMLVFNNKGRSTMHIILNEDLVKFFDFLKQMWTDLFDLNLNKTSKINLEKTLKIFAVPETSLLSYYPDTKNNIQNLPLGKFLEDPNEDEDEEEIQGDEYIEIKTIDDEDE